MKYIAVFVLSIATMLSASASPSATLLVPAARVADGIRGAAGEAASGAVDSLLMVMLGGALISLQLRRRQKSLRSPRTLILGS